MNKVYLKRFFKDVHNEHKDLQYYKCFEYESKYIISNCCSVVLLNKDYGYLEEENNKLKDTIINIYKDFSRGFSLINVVDITEDINNCINEDNVFKLKKEYSGDIKEESEIIKYGVDLKKYDTIKHLIRADKIELCSRFSYGYRYVIKFKNTKTGEVGYLLPMFEY